MLNREQGLDEIYERIKAKRTDLSLKSFRRTPTTPIDEELMPCVFMLEGADTIVEHSQRNQVGYPAKRVMDLTLELIVNSKNHNIKDLFQQLRKVVFTQRIEPFNYSSIVAANTFISENRTEGPGAYQIPNIIGMKLILDLVYTDYNL